MADWLLAVTGALTGCFVSAMFLCVYYGWRGMRRD